MLDDKFMNITKIKSLISSYTRQVSVPKFLQILCFRVQSEGEILSGIIMKLEIHVL